MDANVTGICCKNNKRALPLAKIKTIKHAHLPLGQTIDCFVTEQHKGRQYLFQSRFLFHLGLYFNFQNAREDIYTVYRSVQYNVVSLW